MKREPTVQEYLAAVALCNELGEARANVPRYIIEDETLTPPRVHELLTMEYANRLRILLENRDANNE